MERGPDAAPSESEAKAGLGWANCYAGAKWSSRADRLGGYRRTIVGDYEREREDVWTWTWTWTCRRFWLDLVLTESRCIFYFLVPKNCQTSARSFLIDANKESAKNPSGELRASWRLIKNRSQIGTRLVSAKGGLAPKACCRRCGSDGLMSLWPSSASVSLSGIQPSWPRL